MSIVINDGKCKGMSVAVSMAKEIQDYDLVLTNFTKFNKINLNEVGKYDGKCSGGGRCCSIRRAKKLKIVCWFWKSSQCLTKLLCGKCEWRGWKLE